MQGNAVQSDRQQQHHSRECRRVQDRKRGQRDDAPNRPERRDHDPLEVALHQLRPDDLRSGQRRRQHGHDHDPDDEYR